MPAEGDLVTPMPEPLKPAAPAVAAATAVARSDAMPDDLVVVGRVSGAYGVRGWIKVVPFSDARDSVLRAVPRWWLGGRQHEVLESRPQGSSVVAQLRGVADRNGAEALKGAEVTISRAAFPAAGAGEYYWIDLVGCEVVNPAGTVLGVVTELQEFGAHPVLAVRGPDDVERLIPFVDRHVLSVDLAGRRIVADWDLDY